jgi:hypothetical protein
VNRMCGFRDASPRLSTGNSPLFDGKFNLQNPATSGWTANARVAPRGNRPGSSPISELAAPCGSGNPGGTLCLSGCGSDEGAESDLPAISRIRDV